LAPSIQRSNTFSTAVDRKKGWQARIGALAHFSQALHGLRADRSLCNGLAVGPQPAVADQHDVRAVGDAALAQKARDQLRANASGIAQRERHHRQERLGLAHLL
jgi:hypothetical protein